MVFSPTLLIAAAVAIGGASAKLAGEYKQMVVFGASYVDNAHKKPTSQDSRFAGTGYFNGRYSNGIVLSEHLAKLVGIDPTTKAFKDHAFAGAVVSNKLTPDLTTVWDIGEQVKNYEHTLANQKSGSSSTKRGVPVLDYKEGSPQALSLHAHSYGQSREVRKRHCSEDHGGNSTHAGATPEMLVVVEIGLNTLKALIEDNTTGKIDENVAAIGAALGKIAGSKDLHAVSPNGKFDLLVLPMFPLDSIPNWSENDVNDALVVKSVNQWNTKLGAVKTALAKTLPAGDRLFSWNAAAFWKKAEASVNGGATAASFKAKYGVEFTNAKDACFSGSGSPCSAEATYFYWDSVHPTTHGHLAIANSLLKDAFRVTA